MLVDHALGALGADTVIALIRPRRVADRLGLTPAETVQFKSLTRLVYRKARGS